MRQETLRWGLLMGLIAAILGTVLLAIGALVAPLRLDTTAVDVAFAAFARGMLGFIALGIALGLAYYAGLRSERDLRHRRGAQPVSGEPGISATQAAAKVPWGEQWNAVNTGAIVMLCFWIAATACAYVFPLRQPGVPQPQSVALTNAELHLVLLVIYILFGAGVGGIGGRWYASRIVLDRIIVMPPSLPVTREVKPAQEAATTGATAEHTEAAMVKATESTAAQDDAVPPTDNTPSLLS